MKTIFLGTVEISGILSQLMKGLTEREYKVITLNKQKHKYNYFVKNYRFQTLIQFLTKVSQGIHNKLLRKTLIALRECILFSVLPYYIFKCDTFIFLAGESILYSNFDLPILKFFKKNIIVEFLGSDSRPAYVNGAFENSSTKDLIKINQNLKKRISFIEKYATHIICWPPTSIFFSKNLINGFYIGVPIEINNYVEEKKDGVKILHCPSRLKGKGTYIFRKIINELKNEGYSFEYKELHNVPNSTVKKELKTANIVLDQIYSDVPLAVFASEAASFKVPSIVGGYFNKDNCRYFCDLSNIPPSDYVEPEKIKETLKMYLDNPHYVKQKGEELYNFVNTHYNYKIVTENIIKIVEDKIPDSWFYSPYDVEYIYGFGLSLDEICSRCKKIINEYTPSALLLDDKPKLKRIIINLCDGKIND